MFVTAACITVLRVASNAAWYICAGSTTIPRQSRYLLEEITRRVHLAISSTNLDKIPTVLSFGDILINILVVATFVIVFGVYREVTVVAVVVGGGGGGGGRLWATIKR